MDSLFFLSYPSLTIANKLEENIKYTCHLN